MMEKVVGKLCEKYPDVHQVVQIYNDMVDKCKDFDKLDQKDEKYRPFPLLVGILYKVQQAGPDPVKMGGVDLDQLDQVDSLMHLLGYYWYFIETVGKKIRDGVTIPANKESLEKLQQKLEVNRFDAATKVGISHTDLVRVWVSELRSFIPGEASLSDHCVDYTLSLDHPHHCLVFTIYGTRMFPHPNVHDIVMDLVGSDVPFLGGSAHGGMVTGARNLARNAMQHIQNTLAKFPGYSLLVVGYSLGAALAQLFTMDLLVGNISSCLPANTSIRAITYGCPPVYTGPNIPEFNNILIVNNNHDGISGASVKNLNDVFLKTRAIERLNFKRRIMVQMLFYGHEEKYQENKRQSDSNMEDNTSLNSFIMEEEELESSGKSKITRIGSSLRDRIKSPEIDHWNKVESALGSIPSTQDKFPALRHVSKHVLNIKRSNNQVAIKRFSGFNNIRVFSDQMRLKSGMFDSHMPWAYSSLFKGFGNSEEASKISLEILNNLGDEAEFVGQLGDEPEFVGQLLKTKSLYPDLSEMMS